jgi:hypothetical protein
MPAMTRRQRLALGFSAALLGAGLLAGPAEAHRSTFVPAVDVVPEPVTVTAYTPAPADLAWRAAPASIGIPWTLLGVAAGVIVAGARRPRRNLALALVLLVGLFAFENGVHSVHHLNDSDRGEHCAVASASQHVAGTEVDGVLAAAAPAPAGPARPLPGRVTRSIRSLGEPEGRAPPVSPA